MKKPAAVSSMDELSDVLQVYGEATERLQRSHDQLHSEVARLSAELELKNRLLARKTRLEVLGEMAAGVAHEIRNPLGGILLYAGLLERDLVGSPDHSRLVRAIMNGVRLLDTIVGDLLSFTRGFEPSPMRCSVKDVIEDALHDAIGELARTDIRVHREYPGHDVTMEADADLLRRALLNLVINAIQAMRHTGDLTIRCDLEHADGEAACVVEVADTGPGISEDMLDRIFEPFVTDKEGGTGLGLAIVQKIVESHGGRVSACNRDEGGACFRIALPVKARRGTPAQPQVTEVG